MTDTLLHVLPSAEDTDRDALREQFLKAFARVPKGDLFPTSGFLPAPELESTIETLIQRENLPAQYFTIEVLWQKKMGNAKGQPVWGKTQQVTGLTKYYAEDIDFVILVAANHASDYRITNYMLEAILFEQLLRIDVEVDEDGVSKPVMKDEDLGGFSRGLTTYGAWRPEYRKMQSSMKQAPLVPEGFLS